MAVLQMLLRLLILEQTKKYSKGGNRNGII
jgi:hypothetical protein